MFNAILLDIDGTLVDSNDAHAHAWVAAFTESGVTVDFARVRRCIGMGGDKLMPEVSGITEDSPQGRRIGKRRGEIFTAEWLPRLRPFRDVERLVTALNDRGFSIVAASSAKKTELRALLEIAGVAAMLEGATSSDDAEESKPDPDIIEAALKQAHAEPGEAVMVGDTPYDVEAATRANVRVIGLRCGGWGDEELKGAAELFDDPKALLANYEGSLIGRGVRAAGGIGAASDETDGDLRSGRSRDAGGRRGGEPGEGEETTHVDGA